MTNARPKNRFAGPPSPPTYWSYPETRDAANRVGKAWDKLVSQAHAEEREAARWEAAADVLRAHGVPLPGDPDSPELMAGFARLGASYSPAPVATDWRPCGAA